MIYKNGRMRGRVKEHSIITSPASFNPIYTQSLTAHEEDSIKEGEGIEDKVKNANSTGENAYQEI